MSCGCMSGCGGTVGYVLPSTPPRIQPLTFTVSSLQVRRNQADLSPEEIDNFVSAVKQLKDTYRPGAEISVYDEYVQAHIESMMVMASHQGSAFLPWHRAFIRSFELELQAINPEVTLPYWDFTVDNGPKAALFAETFMGGTGDEEDGYVVHNGPFRAGEWQVAIGGPDLVRNFGQWGLTTLPEPGDVEAALSVPQYDEAPWDTNADVSVSFRNFVEGWNHPTGRSEMHNRVHEWAGGHMLSMSAPNDPLFWLLHSNIDRIWAQWQEQTGGGYLPEKGGPEGHNLYDVMPSVGVAPADVLDHRALGYEYAPPGG